MAAYVVKSLDAQVQTEVHSLSTTVPVRAISDSVGWRKPAFVAESDHVLAVEALDVGGDFRGPIVDCACWAAMTSRLIAELPGEDGG